MYGSPRFGALTRVGLAAALVFAWTRDASADAVRPGSFVTLPRSASVRPSARARAPGRVPAPLWVFSVPDTQLWPPLVASDGTVYLSGSDGVRALDGSGRLLWFAAVGPVADTPALLPDGSLLLVLADGRLSRLASDAAVLPLGEDLPRLAATPLVSESGALVAGDEAGTLRAFDPAGEQLDALGVALAAPLTLAALGPSTFAAAGQDARVAWLSLRTGSWLVLQLPERVIAGPAADGHGGAWFLGDGDILMRVDRDARLVVRTHVHRGLRPVLAVGADGAARLATSDGQIVCVDRAGKELWRRGVEGAPGPITLDASDDAVFVTQRGRLYVIDSRGEARFHVGVQTREPQAVVLGEDGTIFVAMRGMLQAWR